MCVCACISGIEIQTTGPCDLAKKLYNKCYRALPFYLGLITFLYPSSRSIRTWPYVFLELWSINFTHA